MLAPGSIFVHLASLSAAADDNNREFTINSVGSKFNITGRRRYVDISFGANKDKCSALYDTGAAPTAISVPTMRSARSAGALGASIPDHGVTLTNASGSRMAIHGVFWLTMTIAGRTLTEPVVVLTQMSGDAILGQNVIDRHGLFYDEQGCFHFRSKSAPKQAPADWESADLRATSACSIEAGGAVLVSCALFDPSSNLRLPPWQDFIADVSAAPVAAQTDRDGVARIYVSNLGDITQEVARGDLLAKAESFNAYQDASPASATEIASICATAAATARGDRRHQRRPPHDHRRRHQTPNAHTPPSPLSPEKNKLIGEVIQRSKIPSTFQRQYTELLTEFGDVVSEDADDLGHSSTVVHDIDLRSQEPVYTKQYTLPEQDLRFIKESVGKWLRNGVIERANSKFNSAIFCVKKKEGHGLRVVLDYRKLNSQTLPDRYSIKSADQLIREIGQAGGRVFSTIDLRSGFWQMDLAERARKYTAFTLLGQGQFQWKRGAMGLTGCPSSFSRLIEIVTRGLDNVVTYIDDILCFSADHRTHLDHLRPLLSRLRQHGLKINLAKCSFGTAETAYLGHTLTPTGITPGMDKTKAIRALTPPTTTRALKSFLGMCNYFRNYIGSFARKAAPLYKLTRGGSEWTRGDLPAEALAAFRLLQKEVAGNPLLAYPSATGRFHLYIDGALGNDTKPGGLGAVLMQEQADGTERPVGFASRQLQKHEVNYTAFLIEMQAAIFAIDFFGIYLRPNPFVLHSDHRPMSKLSTTHTKTLNRLQRIMEDYPFHVEWVKGEENAVADFLSRNAQPIDGAAIHSLDTSPTALAQGQAEDPMLARVRRALMSYDSRDLPAPWKVIFPQLALKGDILLIKLQARKGFTDRDTWKAIPPTTMRPGIMGAAHASLLGGHQGEMKTRERIREDFWWPGFEADVAGFLRQCLICQEATDKSRPQRTAQQLFVLPESPNDRVHVDLHGPFKDENMEKNFILVITDAFSKYTVLAPLPHKTSEATADLILQKWIYLFGVPKVLVSDGGLEFTNSLQTKLCELLHIDKRTTTPYWPQANGQVETFNKVIDNYLRTAILEAGKTTIDWKLYLGPLQLSYNTAVHRATKVSPFRALLGYNPRAPLWDDLGELLEKDYAAVKQPADRDYLHDWQDRHRATHRIVHSNNLEDQDRRRRAAGCDDDSVPTTANFHVGQKVWAKLHESNASNRKLAAKWEPAEILERISNTTFAVRRSNRRRTRRIVLNAGHLKPLIAGSPPPTTPEDTRLTVDQETERDRSPPPPEPPPPPRRSGRTRRPPASLADSVLEAVGIYLLNGADKLENAVHQESDDQLRSLLIHQQRLLRTSRPPFETVLTHPYGAGIPAPLPGPPAPPQQPQPVAHQIVIPHPPPGFDVVPRHLPPPPPPPPTSPASSSDSSSWEASSGADDWEHDPSLQDLHRRAGRADRNIQRARRRSAEEAEDSAAAARRTQYASRTIPERHPHRQQPPPPYGHGRGLHRPTISGPPGLGRRLADLRQAQDTLLTTHEQRAIRDAQRLREEQLAVEHTMADVLGADVSAEVIRDAAVYYGEAPYAVVRLGPRAHAEYYFRRLCREFPEVFPAGLPRSAAARRLRNFLFQ